MAGFASVPSPLAPTVAPALADPPRREWQDEVGASLGVGAPRPDLEAGREALWPLRQLPGREWPVSSADADPITVELVRGGVDEWRLVVDGVRGKAGDVGATPGPVFLPPPFADAIAKAPASARPADVRPIVVGVRLEAEALAPDRVELVVEQVVQSSERRLVQADSSAEEVVTLATHLLTPYRPDHVTAEVRVLPYLFEAPAQSALGVATFAEAKKYEDREQALSEFNKNRASAVEEDAAARSAFAEAEKLRERENEKIEAFNDAVDDLWRRRQAALKARIQTSTSNANVGNLLLAYLEKRPAPRRTLPKRTYEAEQQLQARLKERPPPALPEYAKADRSFVLGGGATSAAADLAQVFATLTDACKVARASLNDADGERPPRTRLVECIMVMRKALLDKRGGVEVAVLDALLGSSPSYQAVSDATPLDATTGRDPVADGEGWKKQFQVGRQGNVAEFVYDRLHHDVLAQSSTRCRLRFRVYELNGGPPVEAIVEAPPRYGLAAAAAYRDSHADYNNVLDKLFEFQGALIAAAGTEQQPTPSLLARGFAFLRNVFGDAVAASTTTSLPQDEVAALVSRIGPNLYDLVQLLGLVDDRAELRAGLPTSGAYDIFFEAPNEATGNEVEDAAATKIAQQYRLYREWRPRVHQCMPQLLRPKATPIPTMRLDVNSEAPLEAVAALPGDTLPRVAANQREKAQSFVGVAGQSVANFFDYLKRKVVGDPDAERPEQQLRSQAGGIVFSKPDANGVYVWATQNNGLAADTPRARSYLRALENTRGSPIKASVYNARAVVRALRERENTGVKRTLATALGERVRFAEWYIATGETPLDMLRDQLQQPPSASDWVRVPDSLALRFVPTPDATEALHDAEALRQLALGEAIRRVAGPGGDAEGEAELLARRIHIELLGAIRDGWLPPLGERLVVSAPETARVLARHAARLLRAAYGRQGSMATPAVSLDDPVYACLHGGAAARSALRQLAVVTATQAEARRAFLVESDLGRELFAALNGPEGPATPEPPALEELAELQRRRAFGEQRTAAAARVWTPARRSVVDGVCAAWERVAAKHPGGVEPVPVDDGVRSALGSFARVSALGGNAAALLAAASAASALATTRTVGEGNLRAAVSLHAGAVGKAEERMARSAAALPLNERTLRAAIAARRLDLDALRSAPMGNGVDELIDALTRATLKNDVPADEHYFVGGGDTFDREPTSRLYAGTVVRAVWLERLATACKTLAAGADEARLRNNGEALVRARSREATGLERHPLVVSRRSARATSSDDDGSRDVNVWLAKPHPRDETLRELRAGVDDLVSALQLVMADPAAALQTRQTVARSRVLAFNADRFAAGITLAADARATHLRVDADATALNAAAAAIGAAIAPAASPELYLALEDAELARVTLEEIADACDAALKFGCKVATLSEVCVALERFV